MSTSATSNPWDDGDFLDEFERGLHTALEVAKYRKWDVPGDGSAPNLNFSLELPERRNALAGDMFRHGVWREVLTKWNPSGDRDAWIMLVATNVAEKLRQPPRSSKIHPDVLIRVAQQILLRRASLRSSRSIPIDLLVAE